MDIGERRQSHGTDPVGVQPRSSSRRHQMLMPASETAETVEQEELHVLMQAEANVQRIMWTGSRWFMAAIGSVAVVLGFLLSSGWRPAMLPLGLQALWWLASVVVALSIGLIGWSGCPILEVSVPVADRNKTRTMQFGTALFIVGGTLALFAVLLGPSS